jgi:hypothetical protein
MHRNGVDHADILRMDIDGAEAEVLSEYTRW